MSACLTPTWSFPLRQARAARRALVTAGERGVIALSTAVYDEIAEVLARPKFARSLTASRISEVLDLLTAEALWLEPADAVTECRNAKDNRYLELALAASACVIISGDNDLLVLHPWRGMPVLRPADFLKTVGVI